MSEHISAHLKIERPLPEVFDFVRRPEHHSDFDATGTVGEAVTTRPIHGVGDAFTALGDALDSGDLDAAKKAMAQIQSHRAHHGRHVRKAADAESQTAVTATVVQDETPSDGSLNVTA